MRGGKLPAPGLPGVAVGVFLALVGLWGPVHADLWFSDPFDGASGEELDGTAPDTCAGGPIWVAAPWFKADGDISGGTTSGHGSATLAFTPVDGRIYILEASLTGVALTGSAADWIALGFVDGQSNGTGAGDRFINGNVVGKAWMIFRGGGNPDSNRAFLGTTGGSSPGTADGVPWANWTSGTGGDVDLRIVLDTTGGAGQWTAAFHAKRPADADYVEVRAAQTLLAENINAVGLARADHEVVGAVASFSLRDDSNADSDGDCLADAWELRFFRESAGESNATVLAKHDGSGDPDGDGFSNEVEESEGTHPLDPLDRPLVSLLPVSDGDPATDENGYAGSAINSTAFVQDCLLTVGDQQFIAYYRRHATDAAHPDNNTVLVARRDLSSTQWEVFPTPFLSNNIDDAHNVVSCAIDGDGFLHMSWGMHADTFHYAKSTGPVTGNLPITMVEQPMTGQENSVTYPTFRTLPDGDVVFLFREGGSGNGDWYLHRYDTGTDQWSPVHDNGSGVHVPFMKGRDDVPNNCFYPDRLALGPGGMLHMSGVFRYNGDSPAGESGFQTNHRYVYLRSPDGGTSWERSDGSAIDLPVVEAGWFQGLGPNHVPEIVEDIPEGSSLINQAGLTTDSTGRPIIATWFAAAAPSGDHTRQYHVFFHDGTTWHRRTISDRTIDDPGTKLAESQLGTSRMRRPQVMTDAEDRIIVVYTDNRFNRITIVFSLPLAQDPGRTQWSRITLDSAPNPGEPTYDEGRWNRDHVLHLLYQDRSGATNRSSPVAVLEWDAAAYFNAPPRFVMDWQQTPGEVTLSAPTRTGFRYDLRTGTGFLFTDPPAVTVPGDGSWRDFAAWTTDENARFWRLERTEEATNEL